MRICAIALLGVLGCVTPFNKNGIKETAEDTEDTGDTSHDTDTLDTSVDTGLAQEELPSTVVQSERVDMAGMAMLEGDVNGDLADDLVIGAPGAEDGGVAYLLHGPIRTDTRLEEAAMATFHAVSPGDAFGTAVASGDFNGDGIPSIVLSAAGDAVNSYVSVHEGPFSGHVAASTSVLLQSSAPDDAFGTTLAVGDFDGDNIADLAVGAPASAEGGRVDVFRGTMDGLAETPYVSPASVLPAEELGAALVASDLDGDGIIDLAAGAPVGMGAEPGAGRISIFVGPMNAVVDAQLVGERAGDMAGTSLAATDLNRDGYADLVIGAPQSDRAVLNAGAVYVVLGPVRGGPLSGAHAIIVGAQPGAEVGSSVSPAHDMNADNEHDLAIGAPLFDEPELIDAGRTYVVRGPVEGWMSVAEAIYLRGNTEGGKLGTTVLGDTEITGDDRADVLIAAPWSLTPVAIWNGY